MVVKTVALPKEGYRNAHDRRPNPSVTRTKEAFPRRHRGDNRFTALLYLSRGEWPYRTIARDPRAVRRCSRRTTLSFLLHGRGSPDRPQPGTAQDFGTVGGGERKGRSGGKIPAQA